MRRATWTRPHKLRESARLPGGWEEYDDDTTGRKYYCNQRDLSRTWTHPLAADRPQDVDSFQVNHHESETLPGGWEEYDDDTTGRKYYLNQKDLSTTWTHPLAADRPENVRSLQVNDHEPMSLDQRLMTEECQLVSQSASSAPFRALMFSVKLHRLVARRAQQRPSTVHQQDGSDLGSSLVNLSSSWVQAVQDLRLSAKRHSGFDRLVSLGSTYSAEI